MQDTPLRIGSIDIGRNRIARLGIDHRANIGAVHPRITDHQRIHRAGQHFGKVFGNILLHIKATQGRAALPSRLKCRFNNRLYCLLWQRRAVDDHRVQPTGFCNQRRAGVQMFGNRAVNDLCGLG